MKPTITVIGSANVDFVMQVSHLPAVGETVTDGRFFQAFGGKGANQAVAAARAGGEVHLVASLGFDAVARTYLESLRAYGIDTALLTLETDLPCGSALIMFDGNGDNYIAVAAGANARLTADRIYAAEKLIAESKWVLLQQEIPCDSNTTALELAAKHGIPVILNYAPAHDLTLRPNAAVHGLVVNEIEASALARTPVDAGSAGTVAKRLRETGAHRFVAITLGTAGVAFADGSGVGHVPAFPANAVDTTAAGDTFCGTLSVALGENATLSEAIRFASAAAALSVETRGAQSSIPVRTEIDRFLAAR